jgi:hypothetical protein
VDEDGLTAHAGSLDEEGARELVLPAFRSVARGGQARVWVARDNRVCKYTLTIRVQGRLGNAEVDGPVTKTVVLSDPDAAPVTVPEGARKALE